MHGVSFAAACATALAACAGSSGSGSSSNSVGGQPVPTAVLGASIDTSPASLTTPSYTHAQIYFVSEGSACLGTPMEIAASPNATYMRIFLEVAGTSLLPGKYAVGGVTELEADGGIALGSYVVGNFGVENASGTNSVGAVLPATAGSVQITSVSSTQVSGTYDLTFDTRDHVAASFSAPMCPTPSDGGAG